MTKSSQQAQARPRQTNGKGNNFRKEGKKGGKLVQAPVASNRSSRQTGSSRSVYRECERVANVAGSVGFSVVANLACNPGISESFPWLSGHAVLYEKFRVQRLVYRYKNLKGTSSDGNVLMMFDYDTLDAIPTSAIEITQSTVYEDGAPWRIFEMHVPCDNRSYFTRSGAVSGDLKTYDMGRVFVASEGCADTSTHGYLEVEYTIELFGKQAGTNTGPASYTLPCNVYEIEDDQTHGLPYSSFEVANMRTDPDIDDQIDITNNSGVLTFNRAGRYLLKAQTSCDTDLTGSEVILRQSGSTARDFSSIPTGADGSSYRNFVEAIAEVAAGDQISLRWKDTSDVVTVLETFPQGQNSTTLFVIAL